MATAFIASAPVSVNVPVGSAVLRESGLIAFRQEAQSRLYRLEPQVLDETRQWMQAQIDACHSRFDRLGAHLDRMKKAETKRERRHKG